MKKWKVYIVVIFIAADAFFIAATVLKLCDLAEAERAVMMGILASYLYQILFWWQAIFLFITGMYWLFRKNDLE
jgi:hypothetical protein